MGIFEETREDWATQKARLGRMCESWFVSGYSGDVGAREHMLNAKALWTALEGVESLARRLSVYVAGDADQAVQEEYEHTLFPRDERLAKIDYTSFGIQDSN